MANQQMSNDILEAGTGFMPGLSEAIDRLSKQGYVENLVAKYDHFESDSGANKFYPEDFVFDGILRIENSSDPDDQSILYLVSTQDGTKGLYVESYGLYHGEELSKEMIDRFKESRHLL